MPGEVNLPMFIFTECQFQSCYLRHPQLLLWCLLEGHRLQVVTRVVVDPDRGQLIVVVVVVVVITRHGLDPETGGVVRDHEITTFDAEIDLGHASLAVGIGHASLIVVIDPGHASLFVEIDLDHEIVAPVILEGTVDVRPQPHHPHIVVVDPKVESIFIQY